MSAALQNAAIHTNGEATDDDYFAFADSADTEASQAASDTTNKYDLELEVLQFLDDSKKDLETLTVVLLLDLWMYLSFMIVKQDQQLHVMCNWSNFKLLICNLQFGLWFQSNL